MYNGKIINDLLAERGIKKNELLKHLGYSCYTQLRQIVDGNPSVSTIESVADFFEVPIDTFFEREVTITSTSGAAEVTRNKALKYQLEIEKQKTAALSILVDEKQGKIDLLEEMISLLKNQQSVKE